MDTIASSSSSRLEVLETPWVVEGIVGQLRELRERSLQARQRFGRSAKLPSRKALSGIVEGLAAALFPNRLGHRELAVESVDYFVGRTLDVALHDLFSQVLIEILFRAGEQKGSGEQRERALAIVAQFAEGLPALRSTLEADFQEAHALDSSARSIDEVLVCSPGVTAIVYHRIAHALHQLGATLVARVISALAQSLTGVDIHPGASIGASFSIGHGTGIVIGETAILGQRVRLHHGVTLGEMPGTLPTRLADRCETRRHPLLEDDVVVYAGATILGPVVVGTGSLVGGNVWLTHSVPPNSQISQANLRMEDFDGGSGI